MKTLNSDILKSLTEMQEDLLPHQVEALPHIKWLIYGARATGRTHVMCITAILYAIENIGHVVRVIDHFSDTYQVTSFTFEYLKGLLHKYDLMDHFMLNIQNKTIEYLPKPLIKISRDNK